MSKRSRFALLTWVGSSVSVMKKAKMSTDKLLVKEIIQVSVSFLVAEMNITYRATTHTLKSLQTPRILESFMRSVILLYIETPRIVYFSIWKMYMIVVWFATLQTNFFENQKMSYWNSDEIGRWLLLFVLWTKEPIYRGATAPKLIDR